MKNIFFFIIAIYTLCGCSTTIHTGLIADSGYGGIAMGNYENYPLPVYIDNNYSKKFKPIYHTKGSNYESVSTSVTSSYNYYNNTKTDTYTTQQLAGDNIISRISRLMQNSRDNFAKTTKIKATSYFLVVGAGRSVDAKSDIYNTKMKKKEKSK